MYKAITKGSPEKEDKGSIHHGNASQKSKGVTNNRSESIHQLSVQQMADKHLTRQKKAILPVSENQPAQFKIDIKGWDLTDQNKGIGSKYEMFQTVTEKFKPILEKSPLSKGDLNIVEIMGVFNKDFNWFGSTSVFIGNKQKHVEDYKNYDQLTYLKKNQLKSVDAKSPLKIQIALNLKLHDSIENLYTTLLHEWHVHGATWEKTLPVIRQDDLSAKQQIALDNNGVSIDARASEEHKAYAKWSDETLKEKTEELGLEKEQMTKVLELFKSDRDNYKPSVLISKVLSKEVSKVVPTSKNKRKQAQEEKKDKKDNKVAKIDKKKDMEKVKKKRGRPKKKETKLDQMEGVDLDTK